MRFLFGFGLMALAVGIELCALQSLIDGCVFCVRPYGWPDVVVSFAALVAAAWVFVRGLSELAEA